MERGGGELQECGAPEAKEKKVERAVRDDFPRALGSRGRFEWQRFPGEQRKALGGWERRRRRVRRAGRKLLWAPICSCPFKSAKSLTMRGTDQWTKTGRG